MISRRAKAQVAQAVNCPSRICFYSVAHIPRMLLAWFAPLGVQVSSFCQLIFRRWRAQGAQAVNWTSRICFHGFAHIPNILFAWCVPLGFQVSSFVNWYLGGGGHNLHSLWTVLRAYVFIASRISQHNFGLMVPFGRNWSTDFGFAARQNIDFLLLFTALGDLQHTRILIFYCYL